MGSLLVKVIANAIALAIAAWLLSGITVSGSTAGRRILTLRLDHHHRELAAERPTARRTRDMNDR